MSALEIILAVLLILSSVILTVVILMQESRQAGLSGAIAGGADTFFGKTKGKTIDRVLSKLTTVVAIVFALLVIVVYVIQDDNVVTKDNYIDDYINSIDETAAETTVAEDIAETTVAETSSVDAADTTAAE